jgi:hypothetical protein
MKHVSIDHQYAQTRLQYNPETGSLVWLNGNVTGAEVGCIVENKAGNCYKSMSIGRNGLAHNFMVHQMIWFLVTGEWAFELDHRNGNGLDNRWDNLRSVTRSVNNKNHKRQRNNSSGLSGISWSSRGKWRAYGTLEKKQVVLAYTADFFEAVCRRKAWELSNGFTGRHER